MAITYENKYNLLCIVNGAVSKTKGWYYDYPKKQFIVGVDKLKASIIKKAIEAELRETESIVNKGPLKFQPMYRDNIVDEKGNPIPIGYVINFTTVGYTDDYQEKKISVELWLEVKLIQNVEEL